jgi:anti-sigma regulatory factor (Ser/Thr protein kinase)
VCGDTPRSTIALPFTYDAPAIARKFLADSACTVHGTSVLEKAILLTSEAITNAVVHGGPTVVLAVECTERAVEVRVRDGNPAKPLVRHPGALAQGGRGMLLIDALSDAWGVDPVRPVGKEVWFRLNST